MIIIERGGVEYLVIRNLKRLGDRVLITVAWLVPRYRVRKIWNVYTGTWEQVHIG